MITDIYRRAHDHGVVSQAGDVGAFDRALIRLARCSPALAGAADAYASAFDRASLLRRKLVLLLAILETSWPTSESIDSVDAPSHAALVLGLGCRAVAFGATAFATALLLTPLRVSCAVADRWRQR